MWGASPTFHPRKVPRSSKQATGCERASQPRRSTDARAIAFRLRSIGSDDHTNLPAEVAGSMGEEAVVIAARALIADRDPLHTSGASMVGDDGAEIDRGWSSGIATGEPSMDVGTDFIAAATDRRSEV